MATTRIYNSMDEFRQSLNAMVAGLMPHIAQVAKPYSNLLVTQIVQRVSSTGKANDGGYFSAYSDRYRRRKQLHGSGAYGKKVDNKNFYFQGTMWSGYGVTDFKNSATEIEVGVDFRGDNKYKSNAELEIIHSKREDKNITAPSEKEEDDFVKLIEEDIWAYIESAL